MKKALKLIFIIFVFTLLFSCVAVSVFASNDGITSFAIEADGAENANELGAIHWFKATDGKYYIFLPSGVSKSSLTVWFDASADVTCGETKLTSGEATTVFASGDNFVLKCADKTYSVVIMESTGAGTIYVNTESGNMESVHADKSHKEPGEILILNNSGEVQYDGELDYIKGRGNSTWLLDKKPYNIKLESKADLFGMGKHKSWCLLSNGGDLSAIRNQLAYDLARNLGLDVTSETYQCNLYLNGEYAGLYLVTEKVDIGENRVDIYDLEGATEDVNRMDLDEYPLAGKQNSREFDSIKYADIHNDPDEITGGYLLETEKIYRYVNEASGFITKIGQPVVVKTPEYASKEQVKYISGYYQEFEDALYSPTGYNDEGKHYSEYIDVESFARIYVLLEFSANFDGCSSSFYMYKDVGGKLIAGPAWDYDLGFGVAMSNDLINHVANVGDPSLMYIQTCFIGNHAENKNALLAQAFTHMDFQDAVENVWANEFNDYYNTFRSNVEKFRDVAYTSTLMNSIRWNSFGTTDVNTITSHYYGHVGVIANYIDQRYPVLDRAYAKDTCFIKYDIGKYGKALVQDATSYDLGAEVTIANAPVSNTKDINFAHWSTNPDGTGEQFKPGDTIILTETTNLYAQWEDKNFITKIFRLLREFFEKIKALFENITG